MLNPLLEHFMYVASTKSFTEASKYVGISPSALRKQMNKLEDYLQMQLFKRSYKGLKLTMSGSLMYDACAMVMSIGNTFIQEAQSISESPDHSFFASLDPFVSRHILIDILNEFGEIFADYRLYLDPYDKVSVKQSGRLSQYQELGWSRDFHFGAGDNRFWEKYCQFIEVVSFRKEICVTESHPLAEKDSAEIVDLHGFGLFVPGKGMSDVSDRVRADAEAIGCEIEEASFDGEILGYADDYFAVLADESWDQEWIESEAPGMKKIPLIGPEGEYGVPFGFFYSNYPGSEVKLLAEEVRKYAKRHPGNRHPENRRAENHRKPQPAILN